MNDDRRCHRDNCDPSDDRARQYVSCRFQRMRPFIDDFAKLALIYDPRLLRLDECVTSLVEV